MQWDIVATSIYSAAGFSPSYHSSGVHYRYNDLSVIKQNLSYSKSGGFPGEKHMYIAQSKIKVH